MSEELVEGQYQVGDKKYDKAIYDKYLTVMRSGRAAFGCGVVKEFQNFPPDHHDGISLRAYFDEETLFELNRRVVDPLKQLAESYRIPIYPADLWTPHITISDLRYQPGTIKKSRDEVFEEVASGNRIEAAKTLIEGKDVVFDVLFGDSAIVIAATHIPKNFLEAREIMSELATEHSMGEKDFGNILHTTVARIAKSKTGNTDNTAGFNAFGRGIIHIHHQLLNNPIQAQIRAVDFLTNQQFEKTHENKLNLALNN